MSNFTRGETLRADDLNYEFGLLDQDIAELTSQISFQVSAYPIGRNVKEFGVVGDTVGRSDGAITAGTSTLTSASSSFIQSDVGKAVLIQGSGTAGGPQQGTITARLDSHNVIVSFTAVTGISGARFFYGTDDTANIVRASAQAVATGRALLWPAGGYWLASQTTSIPTNSAKWIGEGSSHAFFPYVDQGTTILVSNSATSTFLGLGNAMFRDISFYYPAQTGYQAAPTVYPALFDVTGGSQANNSFDNVRVMNAYRFIHVGPSGGVGRTWVRHSLIYSIDIDFYFENGFADVFEIQDNYFGSGAGGVSGGTNLANYTLNNGHFIYADIGAGTYTLMDGLEVKGGMVLGHRYGIRLLSGTIDVSDITGVKFDSVQTALQIEGTGIIVSTQWVGGMVYSANTNDLSQNSPAINLIQTAGGHNCDLTITGVDFPFALGGVIRDSNGALRTLTFTGNTVKYWGSTTTPGTYYAIAQSGGGAASLTITGNTFEHSSSTNTISGIIVTNSHEATISGNTFSNCNGFSLVYQGSSGLCVVEGNSSFNSGGGTINDVSSGTARLVLGTNAWDKRPGMRAPAVTGGTSPSVTTGSHDMAGTIVVGTGGGVTTGTLTYSTPLLWTPLSVVLSTNGVAKDLRVSATSANSFSWTASADMSSANIFYRVTM
jgi:parallel beta-helix repeat protein